MSYRIFVVTSLLVLLFLSGSLLSQTPPTPPDTPLPDNKPKPGGGLDPAKLSCNQPNKQLLVLLPTKQPVLTTSDTPTLLVYNPDRAEDILYGEFWMNSLDEKTRIYPKTRFKLATQGIFSLNLPKLAKNSLQENQFYAWYLKIYCNDKTPKEPNLDVHGWVKKVAMTPERQKQIDTGNPEIWYDSLFSVAERLRKSPNDTTIQKYWLNLLNFIGVQNLATEPLAGEVIVIDK